MYSCVVNWWKSQKINIRLSLEALKSSNENVITVFLLSVLPSFCIRETTHLLFGPDSMENYWKFFRFEHFSYLCESWTAYMLILGEYPRMLGRNRQTSNLLINIVVHCRHLSLCAKYILSTSKFAESTNISESIANTVCENQFSRILVNLCKNARECRQIFGILLFSAILREFTQAWIELSSYL